MLSPANAVLMVAVMFGTTEFAEAICANCLISDKCDNSTGYCTDFQCKYSWNNQPACNEKCPPLTWGINCPYTCHCPVNDTCNVVNGACGTDTCAARWYGIACQKRMTELYDPPTVVNFSLSGSLLQWTRWSSFKDYGDGPAASYTVQFCKETLSEFCWQAVANGTIMEPNGTSTNSLYAWVPGNANTTYWYRVITNMMYLEVILTGYPSRASLPVTLPPLPTNISSTDLPTVGPVAISTNATSATLVWQQPQLSSSIILPGGALLQLLRYSVTYMMVASLSTPGTCRSASSVSSGASLSQLVPAARTSLLITDLVPFMQYSLAIKAYYSANYSSNATSISFGTNAIAPVITPENVTIGELSSASVTINWLQPLCSSVTGPIVRYDVSVFSDSSLVSATDNINDPSVTVRKVTGLRPLTNYSATVRLVNAVGVGPWSRSLSFRTLDDVPLPPESVIASVVTATRAIISWSLANSTTTVKNVTIAVRDKGRVGCTNSDTLKYVQVVAAGSVRQQELLGLSPSTRYSAELLCTNDVGSSKATAIVFFETPASSPSASVINVSITNITARGMFVIWSPVSCEDANGILLWYDIVATPTGGTGSSGLMQRTTVAAAAPAAAWLTGLQPGTLYYVSVRAVNVEGPGPWGNASSSQLTPNEAPSAVTLLTIENITQSTAIARWVSSVKNLTVTLTKIGAIACGGVNDEILVRLARGVLSSPYPFSSLLPGVRYRVQVAAVNDVAMSDPAITEFVTASSIPNGSVGTPTLNYIPSSNRLAVTWSPIPCEMIYGVFRQYDVVITVNGNQTVVSNSFPFIEVANLLPSTNYSIQIRVVNDAGVGNWSNPLTTMSPYKIPPLPVANLSFNVTYNAASVSWTVPIGSNQGVTYSATLELLRSGNCARLHQPVLVQTLYLSPTAAQVAAQSSSFSVAMQLSGLQPWSDYRLTVTAQNDVGARSTSDNFTTPFGSRPTVAVSNVLVSNVTAFSALASWQPLPCDAWTSPDVAYRYQLTDVVSGLPIATNTTKNATFLLTSLRSYRGYSLVVQAVVGVSFGPSSAAVYFTTLLAVPARVQNIDVNVTSPSSVQLRWSSPDPDDVPASIYELVYQRLATGGCPTASPSFSGAPTMLILTTASLNLEKLQPWSSYAVWLSASNLIGRSPNASTTFNLTYDVPDAPVNLTGRAISDTKLAYSWSQPDCLGLRGPLLGYEYKLVCQPLSTVVKNGTTNSSNVTLVELSAYTEYAFFVRVKNSAASGPWSSFPMLSTLPADPPAPPFIDLLSATSARELLVGFNNTDASNVIRYCLTYYTATDMNAPAAADQTASCTLEGAANTSFIVVRLSNLMPYTNYRIQVRLGTIAGWSDNVVTAVMRTDSSVPGEPASLSLAEFNESSLFFTWKNPLSPNGQLLSYQLNYSQCGSSYANLDCSYSGIVSVSSAMAQLLSGLCPGTCYRIAVAAATDKGLGNVTAVQVFTAPGQPATPPTPELLSVSSATITLRIYAVQPLYGPIDSYLILVSRSNQKRRRFAANSDPSSPASSNSAEIVYAEIAAGDVSVNGYVIVLGDNRTTAGGRYISLPLEPSTSYDVSQVAVSTLSNVTRMSTRAVLTVVTSAAAETALPFWVWIIVAALVVIVLIVLIVVLIICYRRKHRPKRENAKYETYNTSDNDLALYRDQLELINNESWPDGGKDRETSSVPKPVWHGFWSLIYKVETPRYVLMEQQPESAEPFAYSGPSISFDQEFQLLPRVRHASCDVAQRQINAELNRVSHILPYDASRVKLRYPLPATGSDYINASYIKGYGGHPAYIATACPFNDKTRAAFWCMIVQENVAHVVMVTNVVDGSIVKTSQFWPASQGSAEAYGDIAVQNAEVSTLANFTVHRLRVDCGGGGDGYDGVCKEVMLFHFTSWPEHGVPSDVLPFLEFCHVVRSRIKDHRGKRNKGLIAAMCGTGVSTTGVFIAADVLMDQADLEKVVSVYKVVSCLREDRMHMVRTLRQYYFLYDVLFEHLIGHQMLCQVLQLRQHYKTRTTHQSEGRSEFTREFDVLEQFTPQLTKEQCRDALLDANKPKNYSIDVLPPDVYRPVLKGAGGPGNDYINAVFADGYVFKSQYIITQTPLANTIVDFWKLVYEQNVMAIVSLDEPHDISGSSTFSDPFASWLPAARMHRSAEHLLDEPSGVDTVNTMAYGPFCVKCTDQETLLHLTVRRLSLYNKLCPNVRPRELLQLHLTAWPLGNQKAPKTAQALVALEKRLSRWMSHWNVRNNNGCGVQWSPVDTGHRFDSMQSAPQRVLAHCSDGVSRSGLFVAACTLCERIRIEPTINVFHVVKSLKVRRPSAVIDEEQYKFLYRLAWDYAHTPEGVRGWSTARTMSDETRSPATAAMPLRSDSLDENPHDLTDNYHEDDHDEAIGDGPRQKRRLVP